MKNAFRYCRLVCIARIIACCLAYFYSVDAISGGFRQTFDQQLNTNDPENDAVVYFGGRTTTVYRNSCGSFVYNGVSSNCSSSLAKGAACVVTVKYKYGVEGNCSSKVDAQSGFGYKAVCNPNETVVLSGPNIGTCISTPTPTPTPTPIPDVCKQNQGKYVSTAGYLMPYQNSICAGSCEIDFVGGGASTWLCYPPNASGKVLCQTGSAKWVVTGNKCSSSDLVSKDGNSDNTPPDTSPSPPPPSPEQECIKSGKSYGYVNGKVICVPPVNGETVTTTDSSTETKTNSDGTSTTTTTNTTTKDNGDGTVTTTTTGTTKGTGTASDVVSSETKTESKESFCKENPNANICKNSSVVGDCQSFKCEGDAVTCEIAKINWKQYCQFQIPENDPLVIQGKKAMGPDDGSIRNELAAGEFDLSGAIKQDRWITGACPADLVFDVMGQSITMPISKLCPWLEMIGKIGVAICFIVCVFIVTGTKSGE